MEIVKTGNFDELDGALENTVNFVEFTSTLTSWYDLLGWSHHLQRYNWKACEEELKKVNPALLAFMLPLGQVPRDVIESLYEHESKTYDEDTLRKTLKFLHIYGVDIKPSKESDVYQLVMDSEDDDDMDTSDSEEEEESMDEEEEDEEEELGEMSEEEEEED